MKEFLEKISSVAELVKASAKENKALSEQMEEIKKAQAEMVTAFDKTSKDLQEKELVIASQNDRILELESDKFVSDCKAEISKRNAELVIAKQKEDEEKARRTKVIAEKGIKNETTVSKLMALASSKDFDENIEIIDAAIKETMETMKVQAQAKVIEGQEINVSGGVEVDLSTPEQKITNTIREILNN